MNERILTIDVVAGDDGKEQIVCEFLPYSATTNRDIVWCFNIKYHIFA